MAQSRTQWGHPGVKWAVHSGHGSGGVDLARGGGSDDHGPGGDLRKARICYFAQSEGSTHKASGFKSRELNPT
ncbi:hypothetical protein THAOC_32066 [Thalassiosira oceanica]|uniref:Uncharacterized protein n=1 Tax=Thalassiosira oceanica TaxID=159749 RepID=K0R7Z2_THAOC|nr:hypothetical protein THAOC_32066 [Thalassiosira oceanica]|eukprot:EJK49090.1 hypothetical protein THAOC_32066 [Thalassiosira oceanica]